MPRFVSLRRMRVCAARRGHRSMTERNTPIELSGVQSSTNTYSKSSYVWPNSDSAQRPMYFSTP